MELASKIRGSMDATSQYAVVKIAGKQYIVSEGREILVDKLTDPKKTDAKVLLMVNDGKIKLGRPELKDVKIDFEVVKEIEKGVKVRVFKYKSKSRYRKRTGFRALQTRLLVKKIS